MRYAWLGCLLSSSLLLAGTQDSEFNVNTRYTVENVLVAGEGWTTDLIADPHDVKISSSLRREILALIGNKLNPATLDQMATHLRQEFHARTVEHHVLRGQSPEFVRVIFDIKLRPTRFDLSVPKFLYSGKQGWSGSLEGAATVANRNAFTVGVLTDGDQLAARETGVAAHYAYTGVADGRARLNLSFERYTDLWNGSAAALLPSDPGVAGGLYQARENLQPEATLVIARPLTLTAGTSFERLMEQTGPTVSANTIVTAVRYHERLEGSEDQQDLDAAYSLRAASRAMGSDFVYARHSWNFRYATHRGKTVVIDDVTAGVITGQAPLYERFVLGNSSTLRGWNRYDLDPLGGNRMVHNSVDVRYGIFQLFYDSGAVWDRNEAAEFRHSAGVGLRQGIFSLALAFPLREGRIDPVLILSMNY